MTWPDLLVLGVVIGSNNLASALTLGALGQAHRQWRIVSVFGSFEFVVPLAGMMIGQAAARSLAPYVRWLGPGLLVALGLWSVAVALRDRSDDSGLYDAVTTWRGLVMLAAGLSIDNLVIGFSLGLGAASPLLVAGTIACFSMLFTWIGLRLGRESRRHWEQSAAIGSGLLLVVLGVVSAIR